MDAATVKNLIWKLELESYECGAERGDLDEVERLRVELFAAVDALAEEDAE